MLGQGQGLPFFFSPLSAYEMTVVETEIFPNLENKQKNQSPANPYAAPPAPLPALPDYDKG